jgi:ADP-ribose pyrophosphatase YjhB (NUDIX family)
MASLGPGSDDVVVLRVVGSKAPDIKLVEQREPRNGKIWFHAHSLMPNKAPVDAAVRELFDKTCLTITIDDFTMFSGNPDECRYPLVMTISFTSSSRHHFMSRT